MEAAVASASLVISIRRPSGASAVVPMGRARDASFRPRSRRHAGMEGMEKMGDAGDLEARARIRGSGAAPPGRSAASSTVTFSPALAR